MEEETAIREIVKDIEMTAVTDAETTEETEGVMTGKRPGQQFRLLQSLNRNRAVQNRRTLTRKKNIKRMNAMTEGQKGKKARLPLFRLSL